jgi:hypothetical protein
MSTLPERLARLEAKYDSLDEKVDERFESLDAKIDRNHADAQHWRNNTRQMLDTILKKLATFDSLVDQAKGARWLAGLIIAGVGVLATAGLKSVFEWLAGHWR